MRISKPYVFAICVFLPGVQSSLDTLHSCLGSHPFKVLTPSSPEYLSSSTAYNTRLSIAPAAIVYPSSTLHVSQAVLCALKSHVSVSARSGGHSAAGYGLGGSNGTVVIDVSLLDSVTFEDDGRIAVVGTGNRLGDVAKKLFERGRAVPHGTCPTVGVGGHAGTGGFGFPSREWGLLVDRIVGAEIVLADGRAVMASEDENMDLFWAIRGAVSSFGIVTSYKFKTVEAPPVTTAYSYVFQGTAAQAASCFMHFQSRASSSAPAPLGMQFSLIPDLAFELFGSYTGPKADFEEIFTPLVHACETEYPTHAWAEELDWLAYLVSQAGTPPRVSDCFYAKSLMTHEDTPLSYDTVLRFMEYIHSEAPKLRGLGWFVEVDVYGGANSAINAVPRNATAFVHRDRLLGFHMKASSKNLRPPYPESGFAFIDGLAQALRSGGESAMFGSYPSYVDPLLDRDDWPRLYYGENYARLLEVKQAYDPHGVFRFPQAIGQDGRRAETDFNGLAQKGGTVRVALDEL